MKRNYYSIVAFTIAISMVSFSSFINIPSSASAAALPIYVTYDGTGPQDLISNYNFSAKVEVEPNQCTGDNRLCWFKVTDVDNDNDIDAADFDASFDALDVGVTPGSLDDESSQLGILEKRS